MTDSPLIFTLYCISYSVIDLSISAFFLHRILHLKIKRDFVAACAITIVLLGLFTAGFVTVLGFPYMFLYVTFIHLSMTVMVCRLYKQPLAAALPAVFFSFFLYDTFFSVIVSLAYALIDESYATYCLAIYILLPLSAVIFARFFRLENMKQLIDLIVTSAWRWPLTIATALLSLTPTVLLQLLRADRVYSVTVFSFIIILFVVVASSILSSVRKTEQLKTQNTIIRQQEIYVQNLEKVQNELRTFRHDYKNLLSSLYLQVKEGDTSALLDHLQSLTNQLDHTLEDDIFQTTQISSLHIPELKSVLLLKLIAIQEQNTPYQLEILYPVHTVSVKIEDCCRILGILLDNAIEESARTAEPFIRIVISALEDAVTISVQNRVSEPVSLHQIAQRGYSTKGQNRGLGLYSMQQLLNRYDHITAHTSCQDQLFSQTLVIPDQQS